MDGKFRKKSMNNQEQVECALRVGLIARTLFIVIGTKSKELVKRIIVQVQKELDELKAKIETFQD
jgi:hypothetical protein